MPELFAGTVNCELSCVLSDRSKSYATISAKPTEGSIALNVLCPVSIRTLQLPPKIDVPPDVEHESISPSGLFGPNASWPGSMALAPLGGKLLVEIGPVIAIQSMSHPVANGKLPSFVGQD